MASNIDAVDRASASGSVTPDDFEVMGIHVHLDASIAPDEFRLVSGDRTYPFRLVGLQPTPPGDIRVGGSDTDEIRATTED